MSFDVKTGFRRTGNTLTSMVVVLLLSNVLLVVPSPVEAVPENLMYTESYLNHLKDVRRREAYECSPS